MKQHIRPRSIFLLTIFGLWKPTHSKSKIISDLYRLYTIVVVITAITFVVSLICSLLLMTKSISDVIEVGSILIASINACVKAFNTLYRKQRIAEILDMLQRKDCLPKNTEEAQFFVYYDQIERVLIVFCVTLVEVVCMLMMAQALCVSGKFNFFYKSWFPFQINTYFTYVPTFIHHNLGILSIANWNTAIDFLFTGLMMQTCAQIDLINHRIQTLPEIIKAAVQRNIPKNVINRYQRQIIKQSVQHHLHIYKFIDLVKTNFALNVSIQYCLSSLLICISSCQLLKISSNLVETIIMLCFVLLMLLELLLYCWFGNEVSLKSLEFRTTISKTDWPELDINTVKGLLIMMIQTTSPILITCGPFITLSVTTYTNILKFTYSVFNILYRTT